MTILSAFVAGVLAGGALGALAGAAFGAGGRREPLPWWLGVAA